MTATVCKVGISKNKGFLFFFFDASTAGRFVSAPSCSVCLSRRGIIAIKSKNLAWWLLKTVKNGRIWGGAGPSPAGPSTRVSVYPMIPVAPFSPFFPDVDASCNRQARISGNHLFTLKSRIHSRSLWDTLSYPCPTSAACLYIISQMCMILANFRVQALVGSSVG